MQTLQAISASALLAFTLTACTPPQTSTAAAPEAPQPAQASAAAAPTPDAARAETFPTCTWGEVQSGGVSVWSYACPRDRLVPDPALPGFVRELTSQEGEVGRTPVIVLFSKAATAPLNAVLPEVRAASPGAATATCDFEPFPHMAGYYRFMPTGEARTTYDALIASVGSEPAPNDSDYRPCGEWGPSEAGQRAFTVVPGAEDRVAAINLGSEITIYDASTLRRTE